MVRQSTENTEVTGVETGAESSSLGGRIRLLWALSIALVFLVAPLSAQVCSQPMTLRSGTCPVGATSCTTKGSALTWAELDANLINIVNLCNAGGGSASDSFTTINAPSGTDPVADSATDTLNLVCTGLSCTGTSGTDTLTLTVLDVALGSGTTGGYAGSATEGGAATSALAVTGFAASKCARFDASGNLVAASGDCASGDTTGGGSTLSFGTVDMPLGTDPVADTAPDTLTVTCGGGLSCTGTAGTDTADFTVVTAPALAANGSNCAAGQWAAGGDAAGNAEGCTVDDDVPESGDYTGLTGGAGITNTTGTLATASNETGFLTSGALTCGASTAGKAQVHTTPLQYCDNAATPTLRYTAYSDNTGSAYSYGEIINVTAPPNAAACDGVTDDTTNLQAKIDAAPDDATLYIPPGTCITGQLNITAAKDLRILGAGPRKSVLKAKSGATVSLLNVTPAARQDFDIGEFSIDLTDAPTINGLVIGRGEPVRVHDLRVELGAIGISIANTGNSIFERIRTWNQTTAGIQIDGDTSAEIYFDNIDIQRNVAGTMASGFEIVRSASTDGGAYYLTNVRITRGAGTITYGFNFNETGGTASGNPVFMSQCVADNVNGGAAVRFLNQTRVTVTGSWFNNTAGTTGSAVSIDGGSDFRFQGNDFNGSSTGSCVGFANAPTRLRFLGNACITGTAWQMPASSPPTHLFIGANEISATSSTTNDLAKLTAAGSGTVYFNGMRVLTDETGLNRTFSMSDGVNGHIRYQRVNSIGDWEWLNEAFNLVVASITDGGLLTTTGGMVVGNSTGNDSLTFNEEATNPTCAAGDYRIWGNSADAKLKKCQNGTITDLDTVSGGGASNSFETLNAPSGTDPVADSATDTLNVTCSGGLTCTGNSTTDTLDITLTTDDDVPESGDFTNLTAGRSLTINTGTGTIDADAELYEATKCMTIETPVSGDDFLFYRVERAATVTGIDCLVVGGTSVAMLVKECDTSGGTCGNTEASITCGTTNTTEASGIDDAAWDAGDWIRIDPGTVTGSVTQMSVCVTMQIAD